MNFWSRFSLARWHTIGWVGWLLSEKLWVNLMCFKIPRKLYAWSLQRLRLPQWLVFFYLLYMLLWNERVIIILFGATRLMTWGFSGIFLNIWSEPGVLEFNIFWCPTLWAVLNNVCPIWKCYAFSNECNCGKFIIKHHMKFRWDMKSFRILNQSYWSCMKWWVTKIDFCTWLGFPLG